MDIIFKRIHEMRPSSFSEKERTCYQAEKLMLRQFMLMKQQDQVPDYLSVRDMKTWLRTRRSFMEEFQEVIDRHQIKHLLMAELGWTTARRFCLNLMEEELHEEITKEERLSQLWGRKVTLEGLHMFVQVIRPKAEALVQTFLPSLQSKLLRIFGGIQLPPDSAGDAKPTELLELEHITAPVIPEVVNITLKFLLEELEMEGKIKAASTEVGRLLSGTAAPFLSQYGDISRYLLLGVCTTAGRYMVRAIFKETEHLSKIFHQIDYDESAFCVRGRVILMMQDVNPEVQTPAFSQSSSELLKEGLLEVSATNAFEDVTSEERLYEAPLVERETSPEVTLRESLQDEHPEEMVASPEFKVLQVEVVAENFTVKKKKKKERIRAFFRGIWRKMSCCCF